MGLWYYNINWCEFKSYFLIIESFDISYQHNNIKILGHIDIFQMTHYLT